MPTTSAADGARAEDSLHAQLVAATFAILREQGLPGLSLRGVAKRAGVSHAAPFKHFKNFAALLTETAAVGFEMLEERLDDAGAALAPGVGARARLVEACKAYVESAVADPALFTLMFRFDLLDGSQPRYRAASMSTHNQFLRYVRAVQDDGWQADTDTAVVNASIWSLVHGIATLWSDGPLPASLENKATLDELIDRSLDMVLPPRPT